MKKTIYKITVTKWALHNEGHRKSYKKTLLENSFVNDAKIKSLSMTNRWLFLNLIVTCSDHGQGTVEVSSKVLRNILECNRNIDGALDELQSLQLVKYEKIFDAQPFLRVLKERRKACDAKPEQSELAIDLTKPRIQKSADAKASTSRKSPSQTIAIENAEHLLSLIPAEVRANFMALYNDDREYLGRETLKMVSWLLANPRKNLKTIRGWILFVASWLERGWSPYQKSIQVNRPNQQPQIVQE